VPRDRRKRGRTAARRNRTIGTLAALVLVVVAALAVASLFEINAQSSSYRNAINAGYVRLAAPVVDASNRTGAQLAALMNQAAQLPNRPVPRTARSEIQQGLDQAVAATSEQASQATGLVPPNPTGDLSTRFAAVMSARAEATSNLRTAVDRLLGMEPLPLTQGLSGVNAPVTQDTQPLLLVPAASAALTSAGLLFESADRGYEKFLADAHSEHLHFHLPSSAWVTAPAADAPLGPDRLGASASALKASPALVPFHQLVITSAGLVPPAVPPAVAAVATTGGPGIVGDSCRSPLSSAPGPSPAVLPPTATVAANVTVTNCGTVPESGVVVTETVAPVAGQSQPPSNRRGGTAHVRISLRSGSSVALSMPPLPVAGGHVYELTLSLSLPPGANPAGASQQFLLQISA
jgi:hypothetical protein